MVEVRLILTVYRGGIAVIVLSIADLRGGGMDGAVGVVAVLIREPAVAVAVFVADDTLLLFFPLLQKVLVCSTSHDRSENQGNCGTHDTSEPVRRIPECPGKDPQFRLNVCYSFGSSRRF